MENYYLNTITVPIPVEDGRIVIRKGRRVEYETERIYSPDEQNTRVKRKVIGKVDPVQPGRMFPNETYFELFPENEVPADVRDEFLRDCVIRRETGLIRKGREEVIDKVVRGLDRMNYEARGQEPKLPAGEEGNSVRTYAMLRRVFDEMYFAIEELAGKYPNEVIVPFKIERINEVLETLRGSIDDERVRPYLRMAEKGLTYSDALLLMKWYKVLPR